jgi:RsiW-degrading membrane proteinase PrsW (M82 family)
MIRIVILAAAIVPPLLILRFGIAKIGGSWRSEAIWNAFLLGAVSAFAAGACELAANHLLAFDSWSNPVAGSAVKAIFVAAVPEESIKFFVLVALAEKHVDVRRLQDVIILALAVSLGFATLENFGYVISAGDWKITAALRAITSVPGHGIDGLAMGALLVSARLNGIKGIWGAKSALLVPIALHAAYDFPLFAMHHHIAAVWFGAAWLVVIAASATFVIAFCKRVLARAAVADRASHRDRGSIEMMHQLMSSGAIGLIAGHLLSPSTRRPIAQGDAT